MGLVADLSALLVQAYRIWQERRGQSVMTPQELYDVYIGPSYRLLKDLHSDYEDIYLELAERMERDEVVSVETVAWFARARARRAVDRSELTVLAFPSLTGDKVEEINLEAIKYVEAVHNYFRSGEDPQVLTAARVRSMGGSAATDTEIRLRYLLVLSRLRPEDRRAILGEAEPESTLIGTPTRDDVIYSVLAAVRDETSDAFRERLRSLEAEAERAAIMPPLNPTSERRLSPSALYDLRDFRWREILSSHIATQRESLTRRLREVQLHHIRLRIFAKR